FNRVGVVVYPKAKGSDDAMLEAAIEVGADECISDNETHEFVASFENYAGVREALEKKFGEPLSAKIEWRAQNMNPVSDDTGESLVKLLDALDEHDDVQNVYGNYELSDALMAKLAA